MVESLRVVEITNFFDGERVRVARERTLENIAIGMQADSPELAYRGMQARQRELRPDGRSTENDAR